MDSKRDGTSITPLRTSDRLRRRPKYFGRPYLYYKPMIRKRIKSKRRTAASQIVKKLLRPRNRSIKMPSSNVRALALLQVHMTSKLTMHFKMGN